jgi:clan AA aspartic protease/prevent-host-death family protein
MGFVHADFTLTHAFTGSSVSIHALVDTGATDVYVTDKIARALGIDPEELSRVEVAMADGRRIPTPRLPAVEIHYGTRRCFVNVFVLGDECLVGVIPLEGMDLIVDPATQQLIPDPAHPDELSSEELTRSLGMRAVSLSEARVYLSRLVDQAAQGESFVIAKDGKPLVKVMSFVASGDDADGDES